MMKTTEFDKIHKLLEELRHARDAAGAWARADFAHPELLSFRPTEGNSSNVYVWQHQPLSDVPAHMLREATRLAISQRLNDVQFAIAQLGVTVDDDPRDDLVAAPEPAPIPEPRLFPWLLVDRNGTGILAIERHDEWAHANKRIADYDDLDAMGECLANATLDDDPEARDRARADLRQLVASWGDSDVDQRLKALEDEIDEWFRGDEKERDAAQFLGEVRITLSSITHS